MNGFDISQLSPAQLNSLMEMGALDEQGSQLEAQMQQAEALSHPASGAHTTAIGAALGGLGDILRQGKGKLQTQDIEEKQHALMAKKTQGRKSFADLLFGGGNTLGAGTQGPQLQEATPFSYGGQSPSSYSPYGYSPGMWNQGPPYRGGY